MSCASCLELTDVTSRRPKHDGIQFLDRGAVDRLDRQEPQGVAA